MTQFYTDAVTISDKFLDCKVNGLPIGIPFNSKIFIPTQKRCFFTEDVFTFIISPVFKPESISTGQPTDLATGVLKDNENNDDDESSIEVKHEPLKSGDEIDQQIDCPFESVAVSVLVKKELEVEPDETQNRKSHASDDSNDSGPTKRIKMKTIEDELQNNEQEQSRRSLRVNDWGYKPDNLALEAELAEHDSDHTTNQENEVRDNLKCKMRADKGSTCTKIKIKNKKRSKPPNKPAKRDSYPDFRLSGGASLDEENQLEEHREDEKEDVIDDFNDDVYNSIKTQVSIKSLKINLADHTDKYREENFQSYARKDRGKAIEDVSTKLLTCTVCEKFKTGEVIVLENHIGQHISGELNCDQCNFIASYKYELCKHKRIAHKLNILLCPECGENIKYGTKGMKDHLGSEHDSPQWECSHCRKKGKSHVKFATHNLFRKHIEMDHPETLEQCNKCKRLFFYKHFLQNHLKIGCQGTLPPKSYPCEKCGKFYCSQRQVDLHIQRVHNKVRQYQCPHCPYATSEPAKLDFHVNTHSGYHPFRCDQCSFSCVRPSQLTSHMRTHTGEKPYKCTKCKYAAAWKVQLKEHEKVHSLGNTITCVKCDIVFKDKRGLKIHEKKEHPGEETE